MADIPPPDGSDLARPAQGLEPADEPPSAEAAAEAGSDPTAHRGPPSTLARNLVVGPLIVLVIASYIGDTVLFAYHDKHPLLFIALNARNRNLVLASPYLDPVSYYVVGSIRLLISDPLFFLLGMWYGDAGLQWMEKKSPTYGGMLRSAEGWFAKAAYPLIALAPNNFICLFAGAAGISIPVFLALNIGGTVARLWLLRWFGDVFSKPLHSISGFIGDHRIPVLALSFLILGFTIWNERRRGVGQIAELANLDDEISRASAPEANGGPAAEGDADSSGA